jgi:hypothetical protein
MRWTGRFRYSDLNEAARIRGYMGFELWTELGRCQGKVESSASEQSRTFRF